MNVSELIGAAFEQASRKYPEIHTSWVNISFQIGRLMPNSLLTATIQRDGNFDLLLRTMEDEHTPPETASERLPLLSLNHLGALSELWVGSLYEMLRLLKDRKLAPDNDKFNSLAHDFRLLRIPLEKQEITNQAGLTQPIRLRKYPPNNDGTDLYVYDKKDPKRSHIMGSGLSPRGSMMWQAIDLKANASQWIERRELSERFLSVWGS
jgi:hypothetical protein